MSSETPHGYPYPEDSDRVMDGAAAMQALAEAAEEKAGISAAGSGTVTFANSNYATTVVTLPAGRFFDPPSVVATANVSSYSAAIGGITVESFTFSSRTISGSNTSSALPFLWVAHSRG